MNNVAKKILSTRKEWLEERRKSIGGSEAAAVIGLSPWTSNTDLWDIKTGNAEPDEFSNEFVEYGTKAERLLRELYALDFPTMTVQYEPNNLFRNDSYPWAHVSLDGWLTDSDGNRGVLEIKTGRINTALQAGKWRDRIPDHYYVQVLHEIAVYDADFAVVKAHLKHENRGELWIETKHYTIYRVDVQDEIDYLMDEEKKFWETVQNGTRPNRRLPEI